MSTCVLRDVFFTIYPDSLMIAKPELHMALALVLSMDDMEAFKASQHVNVTITGSVRSQVGTSWACQDIYVYSTGKLSTATLGIQKSGSSRHTATLPLYLRVPWSACFGQSGLTAALAPSMQINGSALASSPSACNDPQRVPGNCTLSNSVIITYFGDDTTTPRHATMHGLKIPVSMLSRLRCIQPQISQIAAQPVCYDGLARSSSRLKQLLKSVWSGHESSLDPILNIRILSRWESCGRSTADGGDYLPDYENHSVSIPIQAAMHCLSKPSADHSLPRSHDVVKRVECEVVALWTARETFSTSKISPCVTNSQVAKHHTMIDFPPFCPVAFSDGKDKIKSSHDSYITQSTVDLTIPDFLLTSSIKTPLLTIRYSLELKLKFLWESIHDGQEKLTIFKTEAVIPLCLSLGPQKC